MKAVLVALVFCFVYIPEAETQILKDIKRVFRQTSSLSEKDAADGIREALIKGTDSGVDLVSVTDGYFGNPEIKIPFPQEAKDIESTLRSAGLGKKVDEVVLSINRAAESAASEAAPIFISAIKSMSISDAIGIVNGEDNAATVYLEKTTSGQLNEAFRPVIESSLEKVDATRYWDDVINTYNKIPFVKKMDPDLAGYVTSMAIEGLFVMIAKEELKIRQDPTARTTEILQKVFGQ